MNCLNSSLIVGKVAGMRVGMGAEDKVRVGVEILLPLAEAFERISTNLLSFGLKSKKGFYWRLQ